MSMKPNKWQLPMPMLMCGIFLALEQLAAQPDPNSDTSTGSLKVVAVNGVQLHYQETGTGPPVVLIHGARDDYREWSPQIRLFSEHYRVVAYSRRYNYPNDNPETADHSAIVEARDLASLLDALKLDRVHLVGDSYGALTALFFATQHPDRVHSLTLAEPPILKWLPQIPEGQAELDRFMTTMWKPAGDAFRKEQPETGAADHARLSQRKRRIRESSAGSAPPARERRSGMESADRIARSISNA